MLPSRRSTIILQNITADNWKLITRLVVNRDQLTLVPPNLESLCEHQFYHPFSLVRAIYADDTPVGYIRLQQDLEPAQDLQQESVIGQEQKQEHPPLMYLLKCFMIDQACQGLGFGTRAMGTLQQEMVSRQGFKGIRILMNPFTSVHPDDSPEHFFAGLGFVCSMDDSQEMTWIP